MLDQLASNAIAVAVNRLLAQDPDAQRRLAPFAGRVARIDLAPVSARLQVAAGGTLAAAPARPNAADDDVHVVLAPGSVSAALGDPRALLRHMRIAGDAEFAHALGDVLKSLRFDPEEALAPWVGDIAAVRIADAARAGLAGMREAADQLARSAADYFAAENPILAAAPALQALAADVATARERVDRLAARLDALEAAGRPRGTR
ncbi:MAG TPA: SCP2 domain-containing protein [Burkholderiaceae bacterium]|nr:SCP2 domain-containing protein [Burkholderiaceae bacterium]